MNLKDSIDALGARPDRHAAFTPELLSEAEDEELKAIVEEAARDLNTPIALVNLVLEQIQFFKAHYGLPSDLAAARGTDRDVSFCQFVVRDGQPFEVMDAEFDQRVPQHLVKAYGIRAYLGIPIMANDIIVGSLCVIDTKPRKFSDEERLNLQRLASLVNARLTKLSERRHQSKSSIVEQTAAPALTELRQALAPVQVGISSGRISLTAIAAFLRLMDHSLNTQSVPPEVLKQTLRAAREALNNCKKLFGNMQKGSDMVGQSLAALEHVLSHSSSIQLSEIISSGQALARADLRNVGGTNISSYHLDPLVSTPRSLGVALVATCLSILASRMSGLRLTEGIQLQVENLGSRAAITFRAAGLPPEVYQEITARLRLHTGEDPTVSTEGSEEGVRLLLSIVQPGSKEP